MKKTLHSFMRENLVRTCNGLEFTTQAEEEFQKNMPQFVLTILDDPGLIRFFNKRFLLNNPEVVDAVIISCMVDPLDNPLAKETLALIPEDVLVRSKDLIIKKLEKNPLLLDYIPENLQTNYLQIPLEAVKAMPKALEFVPHKAMYIFPDLCFEACKRDKEAYNFVPWTFIQRYPEIVKYSPYHQTA